MIVRPARNHKELAAAPFSIACLGKQRFDNKDAATSCIKRRRKRGDLKHNKHCGKLRAYRCTRCDGWHIGSSMERG